MKVLLDHMMPHALLRAFDGHEVATAAFMGWGELKNGQLLRAAERQFDVFVTIDRSLRFQQPVHAIDMAILVFEVQRPTPASLARLAEQVSPRLGSFARRKVHVIRGDNDA